MMVVVFIVKAGDPIGERESGLLYLLPYVFLFITGAGKYSLDYLIFGRKLEEDFTS
jgi:putative oxidoreductase